MSWTARLRALFGRDAAETLRREVADVREAWEGLERRADAELSRRERDLEATPEERLAALQREIEETDPFAEVRARLDDVKPSTPPPPNGG